VQHVHSGESTLVRDLDEMWAFIERTIDHLEPKTSKGLK